MMRTPIDLESEIKRTIYGMDGIYGLGRPLSL